MEAARAVTLSVSMHRSRLRAWPAPARRPPGCALPEQTRPGRGAGVPVGLQWPARPGAMFTWPCSGGDSGRGGRRGGGQIMWKCSDAGRLGGTSMVAPPRLVVGAGTMSRPPAGGCSRIWWAAESAVPSLCWEYGWRNRGDREGPSPPGPINFISWVGPGGGGPIYNENGPFLLLLDCFSAIAIVV